MNHRKRNRVSLMVLAFGCIFSITSIVTVSHALPRQNNPKACSVSACQDLRVSTPEEQGMDSNQLLAMLKEIENSNTPIHSVVILRKGALVAEAYFNPYNQDMRHSLYSATKSITSLLVGIAIDEGYIRDVHQKVLEFFPDVTIENDPLQTKDMTIENLLTMSAGHAQDSTAYVYASQNWPQTFFSIPFVTKPGTQFVYDSGVSHLLSCILTKATGMSTAEYAKQHLFDPMQISNYTWETVPAGINPGGWGIYMDPRDMAKLGYLVLNNGKWGQQQLVSQAWIETSTKKHIDAYWGTFKTDDYGYQWWMNSFGGYRANGFGGQIIGVVPEEDLVVVFTSGLSNAETNKINDYATDYILPAIKSAKPICPNPKAVRELRDFARKLEMPAQKEFPLPELAKVISGKTYTTDWDNLSLTLAFKGENTCTLKMRQNGVDHVLSVGLDGAYRISNATQVGNFTFYPWYTQIALKGTWTDDHTFVVNWHYVGEPYASTYKFTFDNSRLTLELTEHVPDINGLAPTQRIVNGIWDGQTPAM